MMKHTDDFKREVVLIAQSSGLSQRRVSSDLDIGLSTLCKWVSVFLPADMLAALQANLARENERLLLESPVLKEQRDFQKNMS